MENNSRPFDTCMIDKVTDEKSPRMRLRVTRIEHFHLPLIYF